MKHAVFSLCLLSALFSLGFTTPERHVLLIVADKLPASVLADESFPNMNKLAREGAVALMNCNTASARNTGNGYITIGAGSVALGTSEVGTAFGREETSEGRTALDIYTARTGRRPAEVAIVHPGIGELLMINRQVSPTLRIGALGEALHRRGLKTAVIGNADTSGQLHREAVTIAMDGSGLVDRGVVSREVTSRDPTFPGGRRTDVAKVLAEVREEYEQVELIVIETGDLLRVEQVRSTLFPGRYRKLFREALDTVDDIVGGVLEVAQENDLILLVVPSPTLEDYERGRGLTPLVAWGRGFQGLLTSQTTRRPGIVTNRDIASTILSFFGIKPTFPLTGKVFWAKPEKDPVGTVLANERQIAATFVYRPLILRTYVILQIAVILLGIFSVVLAVHRFSWLYGFYAGLLVTPLLFLTVDASWFSGSRLALVALILLNILVALVLVRLRPLTMLALSGISVASGLSLDLLFGGRLLASSIMGYDPIIGWRFYGIGNEFMGIFIGSTLLGISSLLELKPQLLKGKYRRRTLLLTLLYLSLGLYLLASPRFGANFGGAFAAFVGLFAFMLLLMGRGRERRQIIIISVLAIAGALLAIILLNWAAPAEMRSHIGDTVDHLVEGQWAEVVDIFLRKAEANFRLLRYSIWSIALLVSMGGFAVLFYSPPGRLKKLFTEKPTLAAGLFAILAASVAAFLANDSGVVPAATVFKYAIIPMLIILIKNPDI